MRFRYSRWDGTQDPLGPELAAADLLDAMSEDLLSGQGADRALSRLLRQGMRRRFTGMDALRARLREARRRERERLNLEGPLQEIQQRLDEILRMERSALSFKAEDDAQFREQFLDSLPPDPAGQIKELKDYRFVDPQAQRKFDELMEWLKDQVLGSYFRSMAEGMRNVSPEQRAELEAVAREVLQDMDRAFQVDRLAGSLSGMFPEMPWEEPALAGGEEAMPMQATVDALERLSDYEELDRAMRADYPGASLEDVDEERLHRALGEDAVRDLRRIREIERALEQAGLVTRTGGRLQVTPKGARKLGERALVRLFDQLKRDREGAHDARRAGGQAEPTGATRPWRFGDAGAIAVQKTVFNALVREGPSPRPRLHPQDFELVDSESRTEAATALLLDLSFSMPLRGHWVPAKRMPLALHALIEGRYPH